MYKKKAKKEEARKTETQSAAGKTENGSSGPLQTDNRSTQSKLSEPGNDENDMEPRDGYAMLTLSANTVFTGGSITISGESIKYKNYKEVEITVTGPSVKDAKSIPLNADGKFATVWFALGKAGEYKVTLKGSDKKATVSEAFTVYEIDGLDNLCDENINLITKAFDHLKEKGFWIVGSSEFASEDARKILKPSHHPWGIVIGNEESGISPKLLEKTDYQVKISNLTNIRILILLITPTKSNIIFNNFLF